jgi:DNA-directed RNA polymerase subunit RPC12/RpoP
VKNIYKCKDCGEEFVYWQDDLEYLPIDLECTECHSTNYEYLRSE